MNPRNSWEQETEDQEPSPWVMLVITLFVLVPVLTILANVALALLAKI